MKQTPAERLKRALEFWMECQLLEIHFKGEIHLLVIEKRVDRGSKYILNRIR